MFEGIATGVFELIGKYTILWNTFERCIYRSECSPKSIVETEYIISAEARRLASELFESLDKKEMINGLFPKGRRHGVLYDVLSEWNKSNGPITETVISGILYRIRCNTFHGTKTAYTIQAQRQMFETINNLLAEILVANGFEQLIY